MRALCLGLLICLWLACGSLSRPGVDDGGQDAGGSGGAGGTGGTGGAGGGVGDAGTGGGFSGTVDVTPHVLTRSRPGARSTAGFRPWRGGIAVVDGWVYWVESGTSPGLYRAPTTACAGPCTAEPLTTVVRPSAFTSAGDSVVVGDVATLRRYFPDGGVQPVATAGAELVNLASDGASVFWTTQSSPIVKTPFGGVSSTLINSNGTPYAMAVAGARVYWVGVDISGQIGALQSITTGGAGPREDSRFSNGFEAMGGNGTYLYYARDSPGQVLRLTLSSGLLETVATNCQGVQDIAVDATHAYWVEPGSAPAYANGRLRRVSHESVTPETLAQSVQLPVGLAVVGKVIFVASGGTPGSSYADGAILRVTLP